MPSIIINGAKNNVKIEALAEALAEQQRQLANKDEVIKALEKKLGYVTSETANNSTTIQSLLKRIEQLEGKKNEWYSRTCPLGHHTTKPKMIRVKDSYGIEVLLLICEECGIVWREKTNLK